MHFHTSFTPRRPTPLWCMLLGLISVLVLAPAGYPEVYAAAPQLVRLLPDEPGIGNGTFGETLAISGDTLVVGEPRSERDARGGGAVIVYVHEESGWRREAVLIPSEEQHEVGFGMAVAISGDTLAVGAPLFRTEEDFVGKVYIYTRSAGIWSLQRTLMEGQGFYHSLFGQSLALDGDRLAIGANAIGAGKIFIYRGAGADWTIETSMSSGSATYLGSFGDGLAMRDGTLVTTDDHQEAAYVFTRGPSGWGPAQKLTIDRSNERWPNAIGSAVAVAGDTLVFGAPRNNSTASPAAAYVFTRVDSTWQHTATLNEADDTEAISFASAFAIDGDRLLVGAPAHHLEGYDIPHLIGNGAAYLYRRAGDTWQLEAFLSGGNDRGVGYFGASVLLAGEQLVVGAPRSNGSYGSADGAVFISRLPALTTAANDSITTNEDAAVTATVLHNDSAGPEGSLDPSAIEVTLLYPPRNGTARVDPGSGTITYTPNPNFSGQDSFSYVAGWGLQAQVQVEVAPMPDPPSFTTTAPLEAVEGRLYRYHVTAADPDQGDLPQITASALPAWLTLDPGSDGTTLLSGTPSLADVGEHPITLVATDRGGLRATQAFTIAVAPLAPPPPSDLAATVVSRSEIELTWRDPSPYEYAFLIERSEAGAPWQWLAQINNSSSSYTDRSVTCATTYAYRVRAVGRNGTSDPSNERSALIDDCTLVAPARLSAMPASPTIIMLRWDDLSDNERGFRVERSPTGADAWEEIGETGANVAWFGDHLGACGPEVEYRVRAFNPGQVSAPTSPVRTSLCPPTAPRLLTAEALGRTAVGLRWEDTANSEYGFEIKVMWADSQDWIVLMSLPADTTSWTVNNLTCGTAARYRVVAINPNGEASSEPVTGTSAACEIIHVDADAQGANDGSSWHNAFTDLQDALVAAQGRTPRTFQIWVAEGVYRPTDGNDRSARFSLVNQAELYGGFAGDETALAERSWRAHPSILSGDIGVSGDTADNSYHVVMSEGVGPATLLDGFTITAGMANGSWVADEHIGGGMLNRKSSPTVRNVIFYANRALTGGGMGNTGLDLTATSGSSPRVEQVAFIGNAGGEGGGMANVYASSPTLVNVLFSGNTGEDGGALSNHWRSSPTLINVTIAQNRATDYGAAMMNSANARPVIRNTIIWGNSAPAGGVFSQIFNEDSYSFAIVSDSLLQSNLDVNEVGGTRNRVADPRFVDADGPDTIVGTSDDDLRLMPDSPAVDAGNNASVPQGVRVDLADRPRFVDDPTVPDTGVGAAPLVDLGAYERLPAADPPLLAINFSEGRPGSAFLITASGMDPGSTWDVTVGNQAIGAVQASPSGAIRLLLKTTPDTPPGRYQITLTRRAALEIATAVVPRIAFTLQAVAPLRVPPTDASDYELAVPSDPTSPTTYTLYLPLLRR